MIDYSDEPGWPAEKTVTSRDQVWVPGTSAGKDTRPLWLRAFYPKSLYPKAYRQMRRDLKRGFARRQQ